MREGREISGEEALDAIVGDMLAKPQSRHAVDVVSHDRSELVRLFLKLKGTLANKCVAVSASARGASDCEATSLRLAFGLTNEGEARYQLRPAPALKVARWLMVFDSHLLDENAIATIREALDRAKQGRSRRPFGGYGLLFFGAPYFGASGGGFASSSLAGRHPVECVRIDGGVDRCRKLDAVLDALCGVPVRSALDDVLGGRVMRGAEDWAARLRLDGLGLEMGSAWSFESMARADGVCRLRNGLLEESACPAVGRLALRFGDIVALTENVDPFRRGDLLRFVGTDREGLLLLEGMDGVSLKLSKRSWIHYRTKCVGRRPDLVPEAIGSCSQYPLVRASSLEMRDARGLDIARLHVVLPDGPVGRRNLYDALSCARAFSRVTFSRPVTAADAIF